MALGMLSNKMQQLCW